MADDQGRYGDVQQKEIDGEWVSFAEDETVRRLKDKIAELKSGGLAERRESDRRTAERRDIERRASERRGAERRSHDPGLQVQYRALGGVERRAGAERRVEHRRSSAERRMGDRRVGPRRQSSAEVPPPPLVLDGPAQPAARTVVLEEAPPKTRTIVLESAARAASAAEQSTAPVLTSGGRDPLIYERPSHRMVIRVHLTALHHLRSR